MCAHLVSALGLDALCCNKRSQHKVLAPDELFSSFSRCRVGTYVLVSRAYSEMYAFTYGGWRRSRIAVCVQPPQHLRLVPAHPGV